MVDKITPSDPRVQTKTASLNGRTYTYLLSTPTSTPSHTILLIHGFPDTSFGWRYQIPLLTSLGLRVIVPDMLGYSSTSAPDSPSEYTYKKISSDLAALIKEELKIEKVLLGGHDWGGAVVYRFAMYYPELLDAVFSVCTPFFPPSKEWRDIAMAPNFKYQAQLRSEEFVEQISGKEKIGGFLKGIYGARSKDGKPVFSTEHGCFYDRLEGIGSSPLVSEEEMSHYVKQFERNGMRGPTNWYRTGKANWEDEKEIADSGKEIRFEMPFLFISATKDAALPPRLGEGMERWFRSLTRGQVEASHWALWERPVEVNRYLEEFLGGVIRVGNRKASL